MIRPTYRAALFAALGLIPALLPVFGAAGPGIWVAYLGVLMCLLVIDGFVAPRKSDIELAIEVPEAIFLGEEASLAASVKSTGPETFGSIQLRLEFSGPVGEVQEVSIPRSTLSADFHIVPKRRGVFRIEKIWASWTGPLGLMERIQSYEARHQSTILPNTRAVRRAAIRLATHHTFISGVKTQRQRGDGSEFDALRKYQQGLDRRFIDWKSSARHRQLLWREHRTERNHNVVLAFDVGRLMSEPVAGLPRLDHAINAGLLLTYLSLKMGDNVGIFAFDNEVRAFHPPQRGIASAQALARTTSELSYSAQETNYTLAMAELRARVQRRSIVIVLTEFIDSIGAELLTENLTRLAKKHLIIFVALRDPYLDHVLDHSPADLVDVGKATLALEMRKERDAVFQKIRKLGVFCVDAAPERISVELLNRYLEVHRRELV